MSAQREEGVLSWPHRYASCQPLPAGYPAGDGLHCLYVTGSRRSRPAQLTGDAGLLPVGAAGTEAVFLAIPLARFTGRC